ncbi:hypothetical protein VTJ04DRAFT_1689 [Mycothermus thermophilus]|uniref:uncharacterized protein n=1 Tax=Humicola insolens TaxID=85995 RepID=UPI0037443248
MRHWEAFDCVYNSGIRHTPYYEGLKGLGEGARAARIIDPHTNLYSSRKLYSRSLNTKPAYSRSDILQHSARMDPAKSRSAISLPNHPSSPPSNTYVLANDISNTTMDMDPPPNKKAYVCCAAFLPSFKVSSRAQAKPTPPNISLFLSGTPKRHSVVLTAETRQVKNQPERNNNKNLSASERQNSHMQPAHKRLEEEILCDTSGQAKPSRSQRASDDPSTSAN